MNLDATVPQPSTSLMSPTRIAGRTPLPHPLAPSPLSAPSLLPCRSPVSPPYHALHPDVPDPTTQRTALLGGLAAAGTASYYAVTDIDTQLAMVSGAGPLVRLMDAELAHVLGIQVGGVGGGGGRVVRVLGASLQSGVMREWRWDGVRRGQAHGALGSRCVLGGRNWSEGSWKQRAGCTHAGVAAKRRTCE